ncbi:MAG: TRC40/GET3/ArsA family transport-energizing ATPase [Patulibacter sp.]
MPARIILFTGKGGVGKTSVAAASARRAAQEGRRTLVVSTDAAHSLGDVLDIAVGDEPTPVADGLDALQIDGRAELTRHWGAVRAWATRSLVARGVDRVSADELTVPPGLEELLSLLRLVALQRSDDYDTIVVDCAPSGETLRLLSFPDIAHWWLQRITPREDELLGAARPLARALLGVSLPDGDVTAEIHRLMESLLAIRALLVDHEHVSIRLVATADQVVIEETRRTFTALALYGVATDAVVVNRLFPDDVGAYFAAWRERQQARMAEIGDAFAPLPILRAPYFDHEVVGAEALDRLGATLYPHAPVSDRLYVGNAREFVVDGDHAELRIAVPFADREDVRLRRSGAELIVDVAGRRRTVLLPPAVADYRPTAATVDGGVLRITLQAPAPTEAR